MIRKGLIEKLFEAASIQRWNDHVRPVELTELDKQAHKIVIAFVIAKFEEEYKNENINWINIIEGEFFEFLHRVILTDIKPPVYHKLMKTRGNDLNKWVIDKLDSDLKELNGSIKNSFEKYLLDPSHAVKERRILRAAHYLASNWEFKIIYHACPFIYGIEKTKEEIENQIEDHYDLIGVQKISLQKKSFGFIDLCGQLRFQKRWAQSPRIPQTSVLGHMLIVAFLSFLCSKEINACNRRIYNNFFCALFHDLPEVLTRDIVSPVKSSIEGLEEIINNYEAIQIEERILPLLPVSWHDEINYFLLNPFDSKIRDTDNSAKTISSDEINAKYNNDKYNPVDGEIIKICDHLAAFIEASISINHGIKSRHLIEGIKNFYDIYRAKELGGIRFGPLFDYFNISA
ncbi:MAG: HD domain-containing protein [Syntrophaceae bacterium]|nr:HD domain-containing protein [Syntrophaceae bacterium]